MSLYTMRRFAFFLFVALIPVPLIAESGCPANVKAVPFHSISRHEMIVEVTINRSGPYDFLLDTGTQMTVVDQALATELHLTPTGKADVAGISFRGVANFAQLDTLEVGDHLVADQGVVVYDMKGVRDAGFALRGLLGEDFLSRFDVLINHSYKVICIDDTGVIRDGMKAEHVARVAPAGAARSDRSHVAPPASDGRLSTR